MKTLTKNDSPKVDEAAGMRHHTSVSGFIGKADLSNFWTYKGSLTTPGCFEGVTWVVFEDRYHVSPKMV